MLQFLDRQRNSWTSLLHFLIGSQQRSFFTARKLRMFACACCRRIQQTTNEPAFLKVVEMSEAQADRLVGPSEMNDAILPVVQMHDEQHRRVFPGDSMNFDGIFGNVKNGLVFFWTSQAIQAAAFLIPGDGHKWTEASVHCAMAASEKCREAVSSERKTYPEDEEKLQADLLRHIFGSPFRLPAAPPQLSATVGQLAESLYAGEDCAFALHDALLEAGHTELAQHFREEQWHPKGCWALDLILGKK
jgi:hypothetical protein